MALKTAEPDRSLHTEFKLQHEQGTEAWLQVDEEQDDEGEDDNEDSI